MRHITIKAALVAGLVASLSSQAASHRKIIFINQYDINQDWNLTELEFEQARLQRFNLTDSDNSGSVSEEEYVFEYKNRLDKQMAKDRKASVKQTVIRFDSLDKNDDNKVLWEEYNRSGDWAFNHFDTNKDGFISKDDEEPVYEREKSKKDKPLTEQEKLEKLEQKLSRARVALRMPTTHNQKGMLKLYDQDGDGKFSKQQFIDQRRAKYDQTDSDGNGWLSQDEYVFEFENRLDKQAAKTRKGAIKQTYVRFEVLDKNKDGEMTFTEYQMSGHRSFKRNDTNKDSVVNFDDPAPKPRKKQSGKGKEKQKEKNNNKTTKVENY